MKTPLLLALLLACTAAQAQTLTLLDPGASSAYLGVACGGPPALDVVAEGFDTAHNAVAIVTARARCALSGRGGRSRSYLACYRVTWVGPVRGTPQLVTYATWASGQTPGVCAVQPDPSAQYEDGAVTLETVLVGGASPVYRAVVVGP